MTHQFNKAAFFEFLTPTVIRVWKEGSPLLPSVRLAQNWLETGGRIHDWFNLGGYKVGSGITNAYWKGRTVNTATWEVYAGKTINTAANWRAYDSIYDFYKDQDLLFTKTRYDRVRAAKTPEAQTAALYACGYATDPDYASKLMSIIKTNDLTVHDKEEEDEDLEKIDVYVNGKKLTDGLYDDKAGVTYVPVRSVAESLGASVKWDGNAKRVDLTAKK
ncbi:glucosaminidase domain-containing protein [Paenibacillus lupini]|uniref:glucosaminidase domain-containing protein n=1 Tax=Paenibacillus lupini TaxID=1450204 RepID=UPI00141F2146|nr:glucosaminidase domain-containing protein [Paenibacillus lupini]NIK24208.1 flagellar protein FlgJ [Paenibacillus lupini]